MSPATQLTTSERDPFAAAIARFEERKDFAKAAIDRLTYADDTDEVTRDLIAVVRAVAGLMPTDDADAMLEQVASDLAHELRTREDYAATERANAAPVRRYADGQAVF